MRLGSSLAAGAWRFLGTLLLQSSDYRVAGPMALFSGFGALAVGPAAAVFAVTVAVFLTFRFGFRRLGTVCYNRGRRIQVVLEEPIGRDSRPPVIYLRSFLDDGTTARSAKGHFGDLDDVEFTEEEELARAMGRFGPFTAIGRPGESLPELGATRLYVSHEEWQQRVLELMKSACLVVLRVGKTPGLWWEAQTAVNSVRSERLVFLLPDDQKQVDAFRVWASGALPRPIPDLSADVQPRYRSFRLSSGRVRTGSLRGILLFEADWTAHFVDLSHAKGGTELHSALEGVLQPVAERLGIALSAPRSAQARGLPSAFLVVFLLLLVVILLFNFGVLLMR